MARLEPIVLLAFLAHVTPYLLFGDLQSERVVVMSLVGVAGVLVLGGFLGTRSRGWTLARGIVFLTAVGLVVQIQGVGGSHFTVWFVAVAMVYPSLLPRYASRAAPYVIALSYFAIAIGDGRHPLEAAPYTILVLAVGMFNAFLGSVALALVDERDDLEVELADAESTLRAAFSHVGHATALVDRREWEFIDVNAAFSAFVDRPIPSLQGERLEAVMDQAELARFKAKVALLRNRDHVLFDVRLRQSSGREVVGAASLSSTGSQGGALLLSVADVDMRVRTEADLRDEEQHFRGLFEVAPAPLLELDFSRALTIARSLRETGLPTRFEERPDLAQDVADAVAVVGANRAALMFFKAGNAVDLMRAALNGRLGEGFGEGLFQAAIGFLDGEDRIEISADIVDMSGDVRHGTLVFSPSYRAGTVRHDRVVGAFFDGTGHHQTASQLRQVEGRLRTVVGGAPVVVTALDTKGIVTLSEGQGLALLGLHPGQAVGRSAFELFHSAPTVVSNIRRALGGESFLATESVGSVIFETKYTAAVENGAVTGVVMVSSDVTARQQATDRLEQLVRNKDQFVATVSHELRTPLTAVVGFAQELEQNIEILTAEEVRTFVELINDQATEVGDLVEDLLVASRIEREEVTVSTEVMDLWVQVEAVLAARRFDKTVIVEPAAGPLKVEGDAVRVRQIIRNLVTNAERYGGDTIRIRERRGVETHAIIVIDDGDGIPEPHRAKIFEPYYRAHEVTGRTESVGLGLAVSRHLANRMEGELTYSYVDGHSYFELSLPAV